MKKYLLLGIFCISVFNIFGQICPYIDFRNNGNGQASRCPNVNGTPMASNFTGTTYATAFNGLSKTGNIRFVFTGTVTAPAIRKIWIGSTLSAAVAGPASVPEIVNGDTRVSYCFYNVNLPASGFYTIEFVDPVTNELRSICGFDGSSNAQANPPLILAQPESQSVCENNTLLLTVTAQAAYGGTLSYQWKKDGNDIPGATAATYSKNNLATADAGNYSCFIGESNGTFVTSASAAITIINCSNNTYMDACGNGEVVTANTDSWTSAWVDYDNDGWEDLYVCDKSGTKSNKLFKNNGNSNFQLVSSSALSLVTSKAVNSTWADFNHDGLKDVYITNATGTPGLLYKNLGSGNFQKIENSGLNKDPQYAHGAVWCDFNLDGYADLLITNFFETRFHQLYKNNGDGTFTLITNSAISFESNRSMAPILCDYDNDGDADVFIPNGNNSPNSLFKNNGNFQFEKITTGEIVTDKYNSVAAAWGDYDNDGWQDLFVCNASGQNNNLYKNNGNGTFTKITNLSLTADGGHSHGANWIDLDNDTDLDLFVTNDQGPNFLYINNGNGTFTRYTDEAIATNLGKSCGQSWADHNKDGKLDVMISSHSDLQDHLFCGKTNNNHWINIQLKGITSNPDAIGARVKVVAGGKQLYRQNYPISAFGGQNSFRQHFGLAATTTIDSIIVSWPSGYKQQLTNISSDQFITINEEPGNILTGIAFSDDNNNCIWDLNELPVANIQFNINPSQLKFASGENGSYSLKVAQGNYSVAIENNSWWSMSCPASANFSGNNGSLTLNLPLTKVQAGHDLSITGERNAWRRGFKGNTIIQVTNNGTQDAENAIIQLDLPSETYLTGMDIPYNYTGSNPYFVQLGTIKAGEIKTVSYEDSLGLNATIGQDLLLSMSVSSNGVDLNESNNTYSYSEKVVGAIDPNEMTVSPAGDGTKGYISKNQWLTYTIHFENVGTYKATFVRLESRLADELDWNSLEIVCSSHSYSYSLSENGTLTVFYNNINLLPASEDKHGAEGFFKYKLKPKQDLEGGKEIYCDAKITFDYEDALQTNQVLNTIKYDNKKEVKQLKLYPNTASDFVTIVLNEEFYKITDPEVILKWEIINSMGKQVMTGTGNSKSSLQLDIHAIQNGSYIIRAYDQLNTMYTGILIKYTTQ